MEKLTFLQEQCLNVLKIINQKIKNELVLAGKKAYSFLGIFISFCLTLK